MGVSSSGTIVYAMDADLRIIGDSDTPIEAGRIDGRRIEVGAIITGAAEIDLIQAEEPSDEGESSPGFTQSVGG